MASLDESIKNILWRYILGHRGDLHKFFAIFLILHHA